MDGDQTGGHDFFVALGNYTNICLATKDNTYVCGNFPALTNAWFQVVAVADDNADVLKIWVNGQLMGTSPSLGNANVGYHSQLYIGCRSFYVDNFFTGAIDDLRIYNRALSDSEVQQLYAYESVSVPVITSQPQGQTAVVGSTVTFAVTAGGTAPLSYQWQFDSTNIAGATASSLTLTSVQPVQAGNYLVVVSNAWGVVTSSNAVLSVVPPTLRDPAHWSGRLVAGRRQCQ